MISYVPVVQIQDISCTAFASFAIICNVSIKSSRKLRDNVFLVISATKFSSAFIF